MWVHFMFYIYIIVITYPYIYLHEIEVKCVKHLYDQIEICFVL